MGNVENCRLELMSVSGRHGCTNEETSFGHDRRVVVYGSSSSMKVFFLNFPTGLLQVEGVSFYILLWNGRMTKIHTVPMRFADL